MLQYVLSIRTLIVLGLSMVLVSQALGEKNKIPQKLYSLVIESGERANMSSSEALVFSRDISPGVVSWVRLFLGSAQLEGESYLRITSLKDGETQILNQKTVREWQNSTA